MTVWRLQTNTDSKTGEKIAAYCISHQVLAMGWSLKDENVANEAARQERNAIVTFADYEAFVRKHGLYGGKVNPSVRRLYRDVQEGDLVWIRTGGIYYLGRVTADSRWQFVCTPEAQHWDAGNQVSHIEWVKIGDEAAVAGAVCTALIGRCTLQRIRKKGVAEYSQMVFNEKSGRQVYPSPTLARTADNFYSLISTDDCEDLLCMWLYARYGYVAIPTTAKKSTELYECVLKDPKTGKNVYPQAKEGNKHLYYEDFAHLDGEVWLFTTGGTVSGDNPNGNIFVADPEKLFRFVGEPIARHLLPDNLLLWYDALKDG